jgi:hypothetical protein
MIFHECVCSWEGNEALLYEHGMTILHISYLRRRTPYADKENNHPYR